MYLICFVFEILIKNKTLSNDVVKNVFQVIGNGTFFLSIDIIHMIYNNRRGEPIDTRDNCILTRHRNKESTVHRRIYYGRWKFFRCRSRRFIESISRISKLPSRRKASDDGRAKNFRINSRPYECSLSAFRNVTNESNHKYITNTRSVVRCTSFGNKRLRVMTRTSFM